MLSGHIFTMRLQSCNFKEHAFSHLLSNAAITIYQSVFHRLRVTRPRSDRAEKEKKYVINKRATAVPAAVTPFDSTLMHGIYKTKFPTNIIFNLSGIYLLKCIKTIRSCPNHLLEMSAFLGLLSHNNIHIINHIFPSKVISCHDKNIWQKYKNSFC